MKYLLVRNTTLLDSMKKMEQFSTDALTATITTTIITNLGVCSSEIFHKSYSMSDGSHKRQCLRFVDHDFTGCKSFPLPNQQLQSIDALPDTKNK